MAHNCMRQFPLRSPEFADLCLVASEDVIVGAPSGGGVSGVASVSQTGGTPGVGAVGRRCLIRLSPAAPLRSLSSSTPRSREIVVNGSCCYSCTAGRAGQSDAWSLAMDAALGGSGTQRSPAPELAWASSCVSQAWFRVGVRLPAYWNRRVTKGWSQIVFRPEPALVGSVQENANDSPRRTLWMITTCK